MTNMSEELSYFLLLICAHFSATQCCPIFHQETPNMTKAILVQLVERPLQPPEASRTCNHVASQSSPQDARLPTLNGSYQELFPTDLSAPDCSQRHSLILRVQLFLFAPYHPYSSAALRANLFYGTLGQVIFFCK